MLPWIGVSGAETLNAGKWMGQFVVTATNSKQYEWLRPQTNRR